MVGTKGKAYSLIEVSESRAYRKALKEFDSEVPRKDYLLKIHIEIFIDSINTKDLKNYDIDFRETHCIEHNDSITAFTIYALSSGPIFTFILNILQGYHFSGNNLEESTTIVLVYHRLIEIFKFAYTKCSEFTDPLTTDIIEVR
ncbi:unnamed protein product [Adineta steineri]|uniref:Uncharacterized protein n=1 Tax=Adineta steineri TaxID=433720 RepID=A0A814T1V4_9BILA|nr:unnamed protein product [Adineta steineri]CAF0847366.1 unnamed protein product [Adineta steineri]CAF1153518.1 unnamed protein product [Adineta steineri]